MGVNIGILRRFLKVDGTYIKVKMDSKTKKSHNKMQNTLLWLLVKQTVTDQLCSLQQVY